MKKKRTRSGCFLILILLISYTSGCQPGGLQSTLTPLPNFIPPTIDPADEDKQAEEISPLPTRQPNCDNQLNFVDDLTIPDGTEVSPGEELIKRWLIRNDGSCNWNLSYSLQLISGLALGTPKVQLLYPARQSTEAVIEINFIAPDNPGRYNSWWQAYDPDGSRFGDPIYMEITVIAE
jgi:hypothetical protein